MAKASITYRWATGECLVVEIKADSSYPDALAELEARALSLFKEAWAVLPDADA